MLLLIMVIAFLVSPGVLGVLMSRKMKLLQKPFRITYTQVLVSTLVFGILYAGLKRYGIVREGFQFRSSSEQPAGDFQETTCGGPQGTKCELARKGSNTLSGRVRYGLCNKNSNKPGFTCYDSLDTYNATNWANGTIVPREQQPGSTPSAAELAFRQNEDEKRARKQKEMNDAAKINTDEYMRNQALLLKDPEIQAFIKRNYKKPYSSLGPIIREASFKIKNAFTIPARGLRRVPIDEAAYKAYIATLS
jgi:hypothetical protein